MPSAWSSSRDAGSAASRLIIERAHEELVAGNVDDHRLQQVRPLVRESWERAWQLRVRAEGLPAVDLGSAELETYRRAHPLAEVMEMIRTLLLPGDPAESGVMVAVGDHVGRLLWVEGDLHQRVLTGEMGFIEGANWSEESVGTAAPGLAIALGQPVQIHESEHYNRLVRPWSCTAAPVFRPGDASPARGHRRHRRCGGGDAAGANAGGCHGEGRRIRTVRLAAEGTQRRTADQALPASARGDPGDAACART